MARLPAEFPFVLGAEGDAPPAASERYARQLKQLLPRGALWNLAPGSWLSNLLLAIADEFARIDARAETLIDEWDPRTALETLADWERVLGLPSIGDTAARQLAAASRLAARGGSTPAYFIALAASLGFVATYDEPAVYTWRLTVDLAQSSSPFQFTRTKARAGLARAGARVVTWGAADLESAVRRSNPAHTVVRFAYLGAE
jgi:uncharacterized protein YmfQ (DUF2313 family)